MGDGVTILCDRVDDTGGAERYWSTVVPALAERGVRVRLAGRIVASDHGFGAPATEIPWGADDERPSPEAAERVRALLAEHAPRAVITAGVFDRHVLAAVRATAPRWIVRIHDHRAFCPHGDRVYPQFSGICTQPMGAGCVVNALVHGCMNGAHAATLTRLNERLALRNEIARADAVLVSTAHMRDTVARNGVAPERIHITPPPLPDDAFSAHPAPPPRHATILFAGRLEPAKGLCSLLRALARIERRRRPFLIVAGRGLAEERRARLLAGTLGVFVYWAGWLTPRALRAAMDGATAICVPSLWPEPFGLVGSEAQARGRPAVAYDTGGMTDWLGDAGIAVSRGDEAALADAIVNIVDPLQWPLRSLRAHRRAERYRLADHIERLMPIVFPTRRTRVLALRR
jgi:glycosyltransferase involved in cell wall biosynthesis